MKPIETIYEESQTFSETYLSEKENTQIYDRTYYDKSAGNFSVSPRNLRNTK